MSSTKIPVTIITGFLGSGKTTLLNNIIKQYSQNRFAVIENEFGSVSIDSNLVLGAQAGIYELSNGCICCSLNAGLAEVIERLIKRAGNIDHLLVETTGIAEPMSIVKTFIDDDFVSKHFVIDSVICVVDAVNIGELIPTQLEIRQQLALSDVLLINKTDLISSDEINSLEKSLHSINPMAEKYKISFGCIDGIPVINNNLYSSRKTAQSVLGFIPGNLRLVSENQNTSEPSSVIHDIVTEAFVFNQAFDLEKFSRWLQHYLYFNKNTIYRAKGIIAFHDMDERYVFQSVRGSVIFDMGEPWQNEPATSKLVFIGKQLDRKVLEESLEALLVK